MAITLMIIRRGFSSSSKHVDIIISGGGMIGTTLATRIGKHPLLSSRRILLLEASHQKKWQFKPTYSNRVSSVNKTTVDLMKSIGAWKHMVDTRVTAVKKMEVWDCTDASVRFDQPLSEEPVSYIVENDVLIASVEKELENLANVTVQYQSKVKNYTLPTENNKQVHVSLEDGSEYTCNLLLGADGANSQVRKAMGVHYLGWNYDQSGIVATLRIEKDSKNDTAWQKFLSTGPVALLPLTDELSSLVWSTTKVNAKTLLQLPNDQFVDALNNALWETPTRPQLVDITNKYVSQVLNRFSAEQENSSPSPPRVLNVEDGSRAAFPLGFGHSVSYVAPSVALVGDAAHKIHPLAGQGVNLGFGDIVCLVDELTDAIRNGNPLGHITALERYESVRQKHNFPTMVAVDLMARIYTSTNPALMTLGSLALQVANSIPPIKEVMMKQAST